MSFETAFLTMMDSTIKVSTRTAHDNYGKPTFTGSTVSYRARIVERPGFVRGPEMEEIAYRHICWVRSTGSVSITVSDRVTLPDGSTPPVVGIEVYPDDDGRHHRKVLLGF